MRSPRMFRIPPDPRIVPRAFREATHDRADLERLASAYGVPVVEDDEDLRRAVRAALLAA